MTPLPRHQPFRRAGRALVVLAALVSLAVTVAPAGAAPACGRQVIDDWYDDGRVDGTYAFHCYDDAIEILPRDVRDYSSAKEDIQRALQAKLRKQPRAGRDDRSLARRRGPGSGTAAPAVPADERNADDRRAGPRIGRRARGGASTRRERELGADPAPDPRRPRRCCSWSEARPAI